MRKSLKRTCKGFTLIEILVAMMILGIASLLLVTMYASVCKQATSNSDFNDRMSEQQKMVENKDTSVSSNYDIYYDSGCDASKYPGGTSGSYKLTIECKTNNANSSFVGEKYTARCVVYSAKNLEDGTPVATDDDNIRVDYKFFVGDNS